MSEYTQEQVEQAKKAIRYADRLGACHVTLHDAEVILSALEAVEKELGSLDKAYIALADEGTKLIAEQAKRAERAEAYADKLEKAGDGMRKVIDEDIWPIAAEIWDAARKDKP
jgi:hypothetical protein